MFIVQESDDHFLTFLRGLLSFWAHRPRRYPRT